MYTVAISISFNSCGTWYQNSYLLFKIIELEGIQCSSNENKLCGLDAYDLWTRVENCMKRTIFDHFRATTNSGLRVVLLKDHISHANMLELNPL